VDAGRGEIADYFSQLPPDAPTDVQLFGFQLTSMHVNEAGLADLKKLAATSAGSRHAKGRTVATPIQCRNTEAF
jgi:hypothetical protein